jgi:hypothetical protein
MKTGTGKYPPAEFIAAETERWGKVVRALNVKVD